MTSSGSFRIQLMLSEPWDDVSLVGEGPYTGGCRLMNEPHSAWEITLDSPLHYGTRDFARFRARPRYADTGPLRTLRRGDSVVCTLSAYAAPHANESADGTLAPSFIGVLTGLG